MPWPYRIGRVLLPQREKCVGVVAWCRAGRMASWAYPSSKTRRSCSTML